VRRIDPELDGKAVRFNEFIFEHGHLGKTFPWMIEHWKTLQVASTSSLTGIFNYGYDIC